MGYRTKLDYSSNRQISQREKTDTILSGSTIFGLPFSGLTVGPNPNQSGYTESHTGIISTFSGNNTTTIYTWFDSRMELAAGYLSAMTPLTSGITQDTGDIFVGNNYNIIDGNISYTDYTGVSFTLSSDYIVDLGGGIYSGTVQHFDLYFLSAASIDYSGRTIWIDNPEITRTDRLIISRNAQPGYVWTCIDSEGMGAWVFNSSATTATIWTAGTGMSSAVLGGSNGIASGVTSVSEGSGTIAGGDYSHAEGGGTTAIGDYSHAEGDSTFAQGQASHAEGNGTIAYGTSSHAEGGGTTAIGNQSHAEGLSTTASGDTSHAEGFYSIASGWHSHAEGYQTTAIGQYSHSEGYQTISYADGSHTEGTYTSATTISSHAEGNLTIASGQASHAEGSQTTAAGPESHAEGAFTTASGSQSHAEGNGTIASGLTAHAEGGLTTAINDYSHAEGFQTTASGEKSHAEGDTCVAIGESSHAEGYSTTAWFNACHAEGSGTWASGASSHAEGVVTLASGYASHAEGHATIAEGNYSHSEGQNTTALGWYSHSEGQNTTAIGQYSHAEGNGAIASGTTSHAEGASTIANGIASHAEGGNTTASGEKSHAEGDGTIASGQTAHAEGLNTISGQFASHSEGMNTTASGMGSHAEGGSTIASGLFSHAENNGNTASGDFSHAEGAGSLASGQTSHAEGYGTVAGGSYSHAEGNVTIASGVGSHSEGWETTAYGGYSHSGGYLSKALGLYSFAHGQSSIASNTNTVVFGQNITGSTANTTYVNNLIIDNQNGLFTSTLGINTSSPSYPLDIRGSNTSRFYYETSANGNIIVSGATGLPRLSASVNSGTYNQSGGVGIGIRGWDDLTYTTYGKPGDSHLYSSKQSNGLVIISSDGTGTEDYIECYVGGDATSGELAIHMHGTGATKGYVGFDTNSPTARLDVNGNGRFRSIGSSASSGALHYTSDGTLTTNTSDERLKTNIVTLTTALDKVKQLRGVTYNWVENPTGDTRIGFIAQEVNNVVPELTFVNPNSEEQYMGVHYDNVTALLVEAVKELSNGLSSTTFLETQTILAEDNNIELNYNGTHESALDGGITIINGISEDNNTYFKINSDGDFVTNVNLIAKGFVIPEYTPQSSSDSYGIIGNFTRDDNYLYIKGSGNWKRVKLEEF